MRDEAEMNDSMWVVGRILKPCCIKALVTVDFDMDLFSRGDILPSKLIATPIHIRPTHIVCQYLKL